MTTALTTREETIGGLRIVREDGDRACYVKVWMGKAKRPDYYQFRSPEARERYIAERVDSWNAHQAATAARAASRKAFDATTVYAVGDILDCSWGYEQTNREFYEVQAVTRQTITLQEIGSKIHHSTGSMSAMVEPDASWHGKITKHRITSESVNVSRYGYKFASKWSGRPVYESSYA